MIAGWMIHLAILSVLLAGAARAAEGVMRLYRRPVRWGWLGALWLPLLIPLAGRGWALLPRDPVAVSSELPPPGGGILLPALDVLTPAAAAPPLLDPILGGGWIVLVLLAAGLIATGHRRLRRRGRDWSPWRVRDTEIWVSPDFGPAVVGFVHPRIVLPRWLLELPSGELEASLLHEEEHRRAGDTRLLLAGLAAVVLAPWNPVAWWSFRRLREAVEIDCDRRVLSRGIPRSAYGAALLTVGRRGSDSFLAAAALSEPPSFLERRLKMITGPEPRRRFVRAAGLTLVAGLLLAVACETPSPTETITPPSAAAGEVTGVGAGDATVGSLTRRKPGSLWQLMESGTVVFRLDGERVDAPVVEALHPADILRIEITRGPAVREFLSEEEAEGIEGVISITTRSSTDPVLREVPSSRGSGGGGVVRARSSSDDADRAGGVGAGGGEARGTYEFRATQDPAADPAFTPYTTSPEMTNRREVVRAIQELHPPLLRDAGIGGRVVVWFRISDEGEVVDARVAEGSEHEALDEAALEVARRARFTPARNGGRPVAVWVTIPITFTP